MKLKINVDRTFKATVAVHFVDGEGNDLTGDMSATFKVVPHNQLRDVSNQDKTLLDLVLVSVSDIDLVDTDGKLLDGDALLYACKNDPSISSALVRTYNENTGKKNLQ